jgi:hypothetical protein
MSKQLTLTDLEKMSPQALIEFMTENIPAEKLRNCLKKVEEFPIEAPTTVIAEGVEETKVLETNPIDYLREQCSKVPIIITKLGKYKESEEDYVYYFKQDSTGIFKFKVDKAEGFEAKHCTDQSGESIDCAKIEEWIKSKIKDGVLQADIRKTLQEYVVNNKVDFISKCPNVKALLESMGIMITDDTLEEPELEIEPVDEFSGMSNQEKFEYLAKNCTEKSGIIFYKLNEKDNTKAVVFIGQTNKDTGVAQWKKFNLKLDDLNSNWCKKVTVDIPGSEKYRRYSQAFSVMDSKLKDELMSAVTNLKEMGVNIPYNFLEAGGSAFGARVVNINDADSQSITKMINDKHNSSGLLKMGNINTEIGNLPVLQTV